MKFTGGQTCWNGPARSTQVHLHCGGDNQLTAVSEPNRYNTVFFAALLSRFINCYEFQYISVYSILNVHGAVQV